MVTSKEISDTPSIRFSVRVKGVDYGDNKSFHEYLIVMRSGGKIVGVEEGPSRQHRTFEDARKAGWERVALLRAHRLMIVPVTNKNIEDGEERSCSCCAIAQSLFMNQARLGMDRYEYDFRVEPYGAFVKCDGIILVHGRTQISTGVKRMPDLVSEARGRLFIESMYEWTVHWDEWAGSRYMTLKEWREEHSDDDCKPYKPTPCSFVLNLSEMSADPLLASTGGSR